VTSIWLGGIRYLSCFVIQTEALYTHTQLQVTVKLQLQRNYVHLKYNAQFYLVSLINVLT